jgi:hypothetical protein
MSNIVFPSPAIPKTRIKTNNTTIITHSKNSPVHYALRHDKCASATALIFFEQTEVFVAVCIAKKPHSVVAYEGTVSHATHRKIHANHLPFLNSPL